MLKLISKRTILGRLLAIVAVVALALSLWGSVVKNLGVIENSTSFSEISKAVLEAIPQSFGVFKPKFSLPPGSENWPLTIGKLLGSIVTYSAILFALFAVLGEQLELIRISFLRNHYIAYGFSPTTKGFLKAVPKGTSAVIVDPENSEKIRKKTHSNGAYYYGVLDADKVVNDLSSARFHKSKGMLIATGDDQKNLEMLEALSEAKTKQLPKHKSLVIEISNPALRERLEADHSFMTMIENAQFRIFNYDQAAAIELADRVTKFFRFHLLASNSPRILLIGEAATSIEIVKQLARTMPAVGNFRLSIDWLIEDRNKLEKSLSSISLPILELISTRQKKKATLSWALSLNVMTCKEAGDMATWPSVSQLDHDNYDAVIFASDKAGDVMAKALALKEEAGKYDTLLCPFFVSSKTKGALDRLLRTIKFENIDVPKYLKHLNISEMPTNAVEPFGRLSSVCQWSLPENERERLARALHENYVSKRLSEQETNAQSTERDASLKPWGELSETYKNANRRAADHASLVDWFLERYRAQSERLQDLEGLSNKELEYLAEVEHNAWRIDRELDGWRYAKVRDNQKKLHPDLVPYNRLSEETKDYDREQVKLLFKPSKS